MKPSLLAKLANAAYILEDSARAAYLAPLGFQEIAFLQGAEDARALLAQSAAGTVLAVQGTQFSRGQVASDLENIKVWEDSGTFPGQVVAGYYEQYSALLPSLAKLPPVVGPLWLTGHSMGGAVVHLFLRLQPLAAVTGAVTFGAPKVGNALFWDGPTPLLTRFVAKRDFAPGWPWLGPWVQPPGATSWLTGHGLQVLSGPPAISFPSFADHSLTGSYIPLLEAAGL